MRSGGMLSYTMDIVLRALSCFRVLHLLSLSDR